MHIYQESIFFKRPLKCSLYLGVSVGHQSHGHDVPQHAPGGEELLADEDSATWTQTLIIQGDSNRGHGLVWSGSSQLHTLLLDLKTSTSVQTTHVIYEGKTT